MIPSWTMAQQRMYRRQVAEMTAKLEAFTDDTRRDLLQRWTGHRSTTEITGPQMRRVIDEQRKLLWRGGVRPARRGDGAKRRTFSQEEFIAKLVGELGWTSTPERLAGFIRHQTHGWKSEVLRLTTPQKSALIVALKGLLDSERRGAAQRERPLNAVSHHGDTERTENGGIQVRTETEGTA